MRYTILFCTLVACSADDSVRFGPTNGLRGQHVPDHPPADAGSAPACTPPLTDAGACPTFTNDIVPMLQPSVWGCTATKCHGPNLVSFQGDANAVYDTMSKYTGGNGKFYINPSCSDVAQSAFDCDVNAKTPKSCWTGARMPALDPTVGNHDPTDSEIKKLEDWIKCGAPK